MTAHIAIFIPEQFVIDKKMSVEEYHFVICYTTPHQLQLGQIGTNLKRQPNLFDAWRWNHGSFIRFFFPSQIYDYLCQDRVYAKYIFANGRGGASYLLRSWRIRIVINSWKP